jgi:hypothetical protein
VLFRNFSFRALLYIVGAVLLDLALVHVLGRVVTAVDGETETEDPLRTGADPKQPRYIWRNPPPGSGKVVRYV